MEELIRRLFEAARQRAGIRNYRFDLTAEQDLQAFIRQGVSRMTAVEINSTERTQLAEKNLLELIDLMIIDARRRSLNESLDTRTFSNSRVNFCPRWPFC